MNQEKIGKFISLKRKEKNLTQQELADKLGVTDRAISKWERGRGMPDYSLIQKLCQKLDVSINDLLSGEENSTEYEKNMLNTIHDADKRIKSKNTIIGVILITIGLLLIIFSFAAFKSESSWGSIISILGLMISLFGLDMIIKKLKYIYRIVILFIYTILIALFLLFVDYINVVKNNEPPRYRYKIEYSGNMIIYYTPFYNAFCLNYNTKNEYYIIDKKKEYNKDTITNIPFNYNECSIDILLSYQNKMSDEFLSHLPLKEYYANYKLDGSSLNINYQVDNRYIKSNYYLYQSLFYNTMSIFALNYDIKEINYYFLNEKYFVNRKIVKNNFDKYDVLMNKYINLNTTFKLYVMDYLNNDLIVADYYKKFFIDSKIVNTKKIVICNYDGTIKRIIDNLTEVKRVTEIFTNGKLLPRNSNVTMESNSWTITLLDDKSQSIMDLNVWQNGFFGRYGKEFGINALDQKDLINILK